MISTCPTVVLWKSSEFNSLCIIYYCEKLHFRATGITLVSIIGILIIPMHVYIFGLLVKAQGRDFSHCIFLDLSFNFVCIPDAKNATIESFWVFRKHAFQFFSNLFCFFLQDTAFIVLTGIYIQVVGYADAVSVAALIVTLLGALGFISNSAGQRTFVHLFHNLLRHTEMNVLVYTEAISGGTLNGLNSALLLVIV